MALVVLAGLVAATALVLPQTAANAAGLTWTVTNYDNDGTTGVYLRNSADINNVNRDAAHFVSYGTQAQLLCYAWGTAVGPYANRIWHDVTILTGANTGRNGWVSDHWMNTPVSTNQPTPGESQCGAPPPPPPPPPPPASGDLPALNVQPPFVGTENRGNWAPPATHPRDFGGDWATDVYAAPGTAVQIRAWPVSQQGAVQYRIASVTSACKAGHGSAGKAVKVELWYQGVYVGWVLYAHLNNVGVSQGQWVPHGQTLGTLAKYSYSTCYQVNNTNGVHTHLELYSNHNWACYLNGAADVPVAYWGVIGRMGGHYADRSGAACP